MPDLFADIEPPPAPARAEADRPLADRLRPRALADLVGQEQLLRPEAPLARMLERGRLASLILWGPPGCGKTTLARLLAKAVGEPLMALSAVMAGVADLRKSFEEAKKQRARGRRPILFIDEIHRFNRTQQDGLLHEVEDGTVTLIGATTENPYFEVNPPLLSRSTLFRLQALDDRAARQLIAKALEAEGATAEDDAIGHLAARANGDGRHTLTSLEVAIALAQQRAGGSGDAVVTLADAEAALGTKALRYGRDDHYDVISAFIKSIRGSDPDAGLYWLATMLEAGEDARFIARRLVILASEDIGEADPLSLLIATAAAQAVEYVGLPEAQLNLSQAVIHLATAPKSNRATTAIGAARADVRDRPSSGVPAHLRDGHYQGAKAIGHGDGYEYPHDDPRGWVDQQHLPPEVAGRRYYLPSQHGREREIAERMARLQQSVEEDR